MTAPENAQHCATCVCGRRAPVQGDRGKPHGTIAWWEHEQAWEGYARRFPGSARQQGPERIAERGGFGYGEVLDQLGHEPMTWSVRS